MFITDFNYINPWLQVIMSKSNKNLIFIMLVQN